MLRVVVYAALLLGSNSCTGAVARNSTRTERLAGERHESTAFEHCVIGVSCAGARDNMLCGSRALFFGPHSFPMSTGDRHHGDMLSLIVSNRAQAQLSTPLGKQDSSCSLGCLGLDRAEAAILQGQDGRSGFDRGRVGAALRMFWMSSLLKA